MAVYLKIKIAFRHFSKRISGQAKRHSKIRILPTSKVTVDVFFLLHKYLKIFLLSFPSSTQTSRPLQTLKNMGSAAGRYLVLVPLRTKSFHSRKKIEKLLRRTQKIYWPNPRHTCYTINMTFIFHRVC